MWQCIDFKHFTVESGRKDWYARTITKWHEQQWTCSKTKIIHLNKSNCIQLYTHTHIYIYLLRTCHEISLLLLMSNKRSTTILLYQGFWTYSIRNDKTLFCACVDNFKQNGVFWHHCACVDKFEQNGVFWRQRLPTVCVWTWPKYNKHHHDLKKQICRFIDMYTGKIFWPTAPCRGCPEKEIWGTGLGRVRFVFWLRWD